jgi:hypothetical protein
MQNKHSKPAGRAAVAVERSVSLLDELDAEAEQLQRGNQREYDQGCGILQATTKLRLTLPYDTTRRLPETKQANAPHERRGEKQ